MSARRLLIALCAALAGLGLLAPAHSLADSPTASPSQVQAPAAAKSSLVSVQAPAAGQAAPAATMTEATTTAPVAEVAPSTTTTATTTGVSGSPPVVIGMAASQPLAASAAPATHATALVLTPPPIPSFPELSPARTGAVTARGSIPVVLGPSSLNEVAAPSTTTNAPFSTVLGISATQAQSVGAVPATIVSSPSAAATVASPSQTVAQAPAVAAAAPKGPYAAQAPAAAAAAPKGPYAVQAPAAQYAAAPKGPYSAQAPVAAAYGGGVSAPASGYSVAQAAPSVAAAQTQLSAVPQLPNTGTGGLLDHPAPPPQTPGILGGLLLAGLLGLAAGLSPSRRARPMPAVRRTSGHRVYWLDVADR